MVKNTIILLVLYFLQFYRTSLRGKEYFANLTNSQEPETFFWPLGVGAGAALEKKSGAGAAKKLAGSPALY